MALRFVIWSIFFLGLVIDIHLKGGGIKQDFTALNIFFLLTSMSAMLSLVYLFEQIRPRLIKALIAFVYGLLFYYQKRVSASFSYDILANHFEYLNSYHGIKQVAEIAYSTFFASDVFVSFVFALLVYFSFSYKPNWAPEVKATLRGLALSGTVIFLVSVVQPYSFGPMTSFLKSAYTYYYPSYNDLQKIALTKFPLPGQNITSKFQTKKNPHIFLIMVESFNARFIGQRNDQGIEYTPFLNQLANEHLYFSNYHSNSIYTAKGQFSALCGQVPMLKSTEFKNDSCFTKKCLPEVLKNNNYATSFFQADPNYNTDNTQNFILKHGFDKMPNLARSCNEESNCYGLGIKDDELYRRVFKYLDANPSDKAQFVSIATVSSHMPFKYLHDEEKILYPHPKNMRENYLNTLRVVDEWMKEFFVQLKKSSFADNSIVIITGDHAFPTGEHGSFHNENYAYEENFGVPLIIYKSHDSLKKQFSNLQSLPFSHLNLGPTVLDLAGISTDTDFIEPSIFEGGKKSELYLVQPYSRGYYSVISWPFKYIYSDFTKNEWLYDLRNDPEEKSPLNPDQYAEKFQKIKSEAGQIYTQQEVYSCDKSNFVATSEYF